MSTQDSVEFHYRLLHYLSSDHQSSDVEEESNERETSLCLCRLHGDMQQKVDFSFWQENLPELWPVLTANLSTSIKLNFDMSKKIFVSLEKTDSLEAVLNTSCSALVNSCILVYKV